MELKDIIKKIGKLQMVFLATQLVSTRGEIFSINHNKLLRISVNTKGRAFVILCDTANGNKKTIEVHRIVAKAFIPNSNPDECTQINHKDENPLNNNIDNLEWCTSKYNSNYGTRNKRLANYFAPVVQEDFFGNRIRIFKNNQSASNYCNCSHSAISKCRTGVNSSCAGYKWKAPTYKELIKLKETIKENKDILYIEL